MLTDLSEILLTAIGSITGTGGLASIFIYRHNKKMRALEAQLKETEVSKARIESKTDEWHLWKEQNEAFAAQNLALIERNRELVSINAEKEDRHQQDIKDWEARFDTQTDRLRDVQRDLITANDREKAHIREIARLERERDHYFNWRCFREEGNDPDNCLRRRPKQPVPIRYVPLDQDRDQT